MVVCRYFLLKHLNFLHSNINLTKFFTWSDEEPFPYLLKPTKDARHNQPLTYMLIWVCYFSPFYRWENGRKKISGSHRDSLLRRDYTFGGHLESPQSPLCVWGGRVCVETLWSCYFPLFPTNSSYAESPTPEQLLLLIVHRSTVTLVEAFNLELAKGPVSV